MDLSKLASGISNHWLIFHAIILFMKSSFVFDNYQAQSLEAS